jgi:hypothetical protein
MLGPGDSAGEMAFFTETPSMEVGGGWGGVGGVGLLREGGGVCGRRWRWAWE